MKDKDLGLTYEQAMHGVQIAIKYKLNKLTDQFADESFVGHRHMRVGVDSAHISNLGLAELLISKGVFTMEEYLEHMRLAANAEVYDYQVAYPGIKFR